MSWKGVNMFFWARLARFRRLRASKIHMRASFRNCTLVCNQLPPDSTQMLLVSELYRICVRRDYNGPKIQVRVCHVVASVRSWRRTSKCFESETFEVIPLGHQSSCRRYQIFGRRRDKYFHDISRQRVYDIGIAIGINLWG